MLLCINRGFVIPDDIKAICKDVMRHRIGLTYEAEAENVKSETIISEILKQLMCHKSCKAVVKSESDF